MSEQTIHKTPVVEGESRLNVREWPETENGPGRCANTVIPGPRRSAKEID